MSDRYGSYPPDDEPIIGQTYPPAQQSPSPPGAAAPSVPYYEDEDEYGDYDEYGEEDEYYDDEYYDETPARQPLFYLFIGLAAVVGAVIIFLLFSLVRSGGDSGTPTPGTKAAAQFKVRIDSPTDGSRVQIGKGEDVIVEATSTQPIAKFELFVGDSAVDTQNVSAPSTGQSYRATLKLPAFKQRGTYKIFVRVTTSTNEKSDSDKISLVAIEPVDAPPQQIKGKVIATVNVRRGPGDNFELVKTLDTGQEVTITGKSRDGLWLLVDIEGGTWVKAAAIDPQDSIALVPVREPTPVPTATATAAPSASPSPSPSPTPSGKLPDLLPQGAQLSDNGTKLRVAIINQSTNSYSGPLVVSVTGATDAPLKQVFNVDLAAGGSATVSFDLNPPVTTSKTVTVKVDPDNAIKETNKDNNSITATLQPPVESPVLGIINVDPNGVTLTVRNTGGALASTTVRVKVTIKTATGETKAAESSKTVALAKGQDVTFSIAKPGSGTGTIEVFIGDNPTPVTSSPITIP